MSQYHYHSNVHRQMRRFRRIRRMALIPLVVIILFGVGIGVYIWQQAENNQSVPQASQPVSLGHYTGAPKRLITNEQFSFESTNEWQFSREESRLPHEYVFFSQRDGYIEYELNIRVNSQLPNEPANYIAPVVVKNGMLEVQEISPRCTSNKNPKPENENQQFKGVKFTCGVLSSQEVIAAAVVGGSYGIPLYGANGQVNTVSIFFRNHTQKYQPDPFSQVVTSFRLK